MHYMIFILYKCCILSELCDPSKQGRLRNLTSLCSGEQFAAKNHISP